MANGITLRADYGPYIVTAISPTQHFYTDTGLSAAVTLPATITTKTTWYCAPAYSAEYTFTVTQLDGSDISPGAPQWVGTTADSTLNPRPSWGQLAADVTLSSLANGQAVVIDTHDRRHVTSQTAPSAGSMYLTFFTALRSMTVTTMTAGSASATSGSPTLIRYGLFTVASDNACTLVASTASDTAIFGSANTAYPKDLSTPYAVTSGVRYAAGLLIVGGTPGGVVGSTGSNGIMGLAPRVSAYKAGLSDLPSSVASGALGDDSRSFFFRLS